MPGSDYGGGIGSDGRRGAHPPGVDESRAIVCALGLLALDDTGEVRIVRAALHDLGLDPDILLLAERGGAFVVSGDDVHFLDAADRQRAADAVTPTERRAAHGALARVLIEPRHRTFCA